MTQNNTEQTHYCEDCDEPLALLYDDREGEDTPIVCGHCGGNNTRSLRTGTEHTPN